MKVEIKVMKKIQTEGTLEMENLGKLTETTETSISNRIQEIGERISGAADSIEEIDSLIKENSKSNKFFTQNTQKTWDTMKTPNLIIIGVEEGEFQLKAQIIYSTKL